MNFEFDKEMDFLLRDHLKTERAAGNSLAEPNANTAHLDADDLAAFAENSLPQTARQQFAAHLADCNDCRKTLSSLILINETETEEAAAAETIQVIKPARVSWLESLQKLFEFPTLGYATAGLALLLVGTIAFVALRSPNQTQDATIAKIKPTELAPAQPEAAAPTTAAVAPTIELKQEQLSKEAAPSSNVETATEAAPADISASAQSNSAASAEPPSVRATRDAAGGNNRSDSAANTTAAARENQPAGSTASANTNAAASTDAPRARSTSSKPVAVAETRAPASRPAQPERRDAEAPRKQEREADKSSDDMSDIFTTARAAPLPSTTESRTVSGKTFQRPFNVWQDSSYKQQATQLVLRGSKDYKKLPAGLRAVAEKLSGEVIVVWQNKAYRIR